MTTDTRTNAQRFASSLDHCEKASSALSAACDALRDALAELRMAKIDLPINDPSTVLLKVRNGHAAARIEDVLNLLFHSTKHSTADLSVSTYDRLTIESAKEKEVPTA